MKNDSPTELIRRYRRKLAAAFDNDIQRIADDLRRQEILSGQEILLPPGEEHLALPTKDSDDAQEAALTASKHPNMAPPNRATTTAVQQAL